MRWVPTYSVVVYGTDRSRMQAAVELGLRRSAPSGPIVIQLSSRQRVDASEPAAAERAVKVSKEAFDLLAACVRYSEASEGAFDITVGPLMKVWGFYKGSGQFPHRAEIRGAMANVGYKNIVLDPQDADRAVSPGREWKSILAASEKDMRWTGWWQSSARTASCPG